MKYELTSPFGFEVAVCSRCSGSGQYSYNQIDGSRCYGCGGSGKKHTKRGKAAKLFYVESLKLMPEDIKVGQRIDNDCGKYTVAEIVGIEESGAVIIDGVRKPMEFLVFISAQGTRVSVQMGYPVKLVPQGEEKARLVAAALAYQDTLTATGTPRKNADKSA